MYASDYCLKCKTNATDNSQNFVLAGNQCFPENVRSCGSGYYQEELTTDCKLCDVTCIECDGPLSDNCLVCPHDRPNLQYQHCVVNCDTSYYLNKEISKCLK